MDFIEFVSNCWIGLLIVLCGVILVSIGVICAININKAIKQVIRATVSDCIIGESVIGGMITQCYDVTLAVPTLKGIAYKIIKKGQELPIGTIVDVYYDYKDDEVCIAELRKKEKDSHPKVFSIVGCVAIVVGLFIALIQGFGFNGMIFGYTVGIAVCLAVAYLGLWLAFFRPIKLSNEEENCIKVRGVQVDYVKISSKNGNSSYAPIYEYRYNGKIKKYKSKIGGNSPKYKQNGKEVTIVINRKKDKIYCLEESRETSKMGIYIMIFGILILIGIVTGLINDLTRGV